MQTLSVKQKAALESARLSAMARGLFVRLSDDGQRIETRINESDAKPIITIELPRE
jgi:hypothetical protein